MGLLDELGFWWEFSIPDVFSEGFGLPFRLTRGAQEPARCCNGHIITGGV